MGEALHEVMAGRTTGVLRFAPAVTVAVLLLPIVAGLVGTLLPAFGYLPAIGGSSFGVDGWRRLFAAPGIATSIGSTLFTGILASVLSVLLAIAFCAWAWGRPWTRRVGSWLAPILATPHSAIALGLAFLVAPSGWVVRAISPWLTGWTIPPDVATVGHAGGLALVLGLMVKEVPYLTLMIVGAMHQVAAAPQLSVARAAGYARAEAWLKVILPQIYPQIRLPFYAVIAFSLSVVDVALILGPTNPPTLAVQAVRWFIDADITFYFQASAAAILLLAMVVTVVAGWFLLERVAIVLGRRWIVRGRRHGPMNGIVATLAGSGVVLFALAMLAIVGMGVWSFAVQWRFPDALPQAWSLANLLRRVQGLAEPAQWTLVLGMAATAIALVLAVACLENESRTRIKTGSRTLCILYVPLLLPQVAFLFCAQVLLVRLNLDGAVGAVIFAHLVFVLPYLFLSLADPWRSLDPRYARTAASLGASPTRILLRVKLPLLLRPVLIACAVAFAVSVGQYLATLFAGNGRIPTLTTEAVTLAAGADRRVIGAYALMQSALPMLFFLAAALVPALLYRNRRGVQGWQ
ncbi:MAG: ABC transporter permease [Casimicrobiaceae bacterium]